MYNIFSFFFVNKENITMVGACVLLLYINIYVCHGSVRNVNDEVKYFCCGVRAFI